METSTGELRLYSIAADGCFNFRTSLSTFWFAQAVSVPSLINRSKELYKSNIVEYKNAWNIVKNSKIYEYNLKDELDNDIDQKHYGFIIERETPKEIIAGNGEGVDIYSISSLNWLATQE
ncbi:tail fiber domain-containing protein, partial [Coprobacillus cateniformis]|nr:tail fiber domain-containing protein [Coprobacillus cateniformis]